MKCPNCATEAEAAEFCPNCGAGMPQGRRKPTTGAVIWRTLVGAAIFTLAVAIGLGGTCFVLFGIGSVDSRSAGGEAGLMLLGGLLAVVAAVFLIRWAFRLWSS